MGKSKTGHVKKGVDENPVDACKAGSETEYVKKGVHENPVDACKGWFDSCEYCDKRFSKWIAVDEEVYEKIPAKPGFFMIALKNKSVTEVVSILYNQSNIQKPSIPEINNIKDQISDKKKKSTKSEMLVRWMVIKKLDGKENSVLCAHWQNNGVLPKFITSWPAQELMEESESIVFSNRTQKWCYPQKNPVWRKSKPAPSKNLEEVKKCNFQSCKICDYHFTPWQSLEDVIKQDLAPNKNGVVMLSVLVYGKSREIVIISSDRTNVVKPIKSTIKYCDANEYYLKNTKFENRNTLQVRWMTMKDVDSDNSCFFFAHWYNADSWPKHNTYYMHLFGEMSLNKNKHFVFRINDKKWFYETETLKSSKFSKAKNRRRLLDELNAEDYDTEFS